MKKERNVKRKQKYNAKWVWPDGLEGAKALKSHLRSLLRYRLKQYFKNLDGMLICKPSQRGPMYDLKCKSWVTFHLLWSCSIPSTPLLTVTVKFG